MIVLEKSLAAPVFGASDLGEVAVPGKMLGLGDSVVPPVIAARCAPEVPGFLVVLDAWHGCPFLSCDRLFDRSQSLWRNKLSVRIHLPFFLLFFPMTRPGRPCSANS
jgi:hypothetical protein